MASAHSNLLVMLLVLTTPTFAQTACKVIGVADGACREYLKNPGYLSLEKEARTKRQGLWADNNPIYPRDFRR